MGGNGRVQGSPVAGLGGSIKAAQEPEELIGRTSTLGRTAAKRLTCVEWQCQPVCTATPDAKTGEGGIMKNIIITVLYMAILGFGSARAGDAEDIRATFERFVAAQNAHDTKAVAGMLKEGDDFLWITRGTPIWGHDAAMKRFEATYQGTWSLNPVMADFRFISLGHDAAQLFVPVIFQIGPPGQPAQTMKFFINLTLVKVGSQWRVASILPVPAPA